MDHSTEGVTLRSGFVFAVLNQYESMKSVCRPIFEMASDLDPSHPEQMCEMSLYNDICDWIEKTFGAANIRKAGEAIGNEVYNQLVKDGALGENPSPLQILQGLKQAASFMISDPKGRGWEIVDSADKRVRMRRTQTFNCKLQEGLLVSLVERTGVMLPSVEHARCTRRGDEFCEYEVNWVGH